MRVRELRGLHKSKKQKCFQDLPYYAHTEAIQHSEVVKNYLTPAYSVNLVENLPSPSHHLKKSDIPGRVYEFLLFSGTELIDTVMIKWGLQTFQRPIQWYLPICPETTYSVSLIFLMQDMVINAAYFHENFETLSAIIRKRVFPADWELLTQGEEIIADTLWGIFSLYSATTLGFLAAQFLDLVGHKELAIFAGTVYANASLVGSVKDLENMRIRIRNLHQNRYSRECNVSLAKILGWAFALNSSSSVVIMCFDATVSTLHVTDDNTKLGLLVMNILAASISINEYANNNAKLIQKVFNELRRMNFRPSLLQTACFLVAAYFSSLITDSYDPIYSEQYDEELLPYVSMSASTSNALSFMAAFSQTLGITVGVYSLLEKAYQKLTAALSRCRRRPTPHEVQIKTPPTPSLSTNPASFYFQPPGESMSPFAIEIPPASKSLLENNASRKISRCSIM